MRKILLAASLLMLLFAGSISSNFALANEALSRQAMGKAIPDRSKIAAIVIDDFGNAMKGTKEMLALPYPLTAAVMPFLTTSKQDAENAFRSGKEVIVHLPMEPVKGNPKWLGPGAIFTNLSDDEIRKRVNAAIDDIPHAIGINNHMGSKATGDARVMRIILEECKKRNLFFVDSHTNYRSVACRTAEELGVPCIENELFLDDSHTAGHVSGQLTLMRTRLSKQAYVVAIGHVGIGGLVTSGVLKDKLPEFTEHVQLLPISKLIGLKRDGMLPE